MFGNLLAPLPLIGRPFRQRNQLLTEREALQRELRLAQAELDQCRQVANESLKVATEDWRSSEFLSKLRSQLHTTRFYASPHDDGAQEREVGEFRDFIRVRSSVARALEIGPSFNPILPKKSGFDVCIVDHADQAGLRAKYASEPVDIEAIEPVDVVWTGGPLSQQLAARKFGAIVASHVVEHAPDFVGFLSDLSQMLEDDGAIYLIVPDQRFCYDLLQPTSDTAKVVADHAAARSRHTYESQLRNASQVVVDPPQPADIWWSHQAPPAGIKLRFPELQASFEGAREAVAATEYVDVHGNYFSPSSFLLICIETYAMGLHHLVPRVVTRSRGCEFLVVLERSTDQPLQEPELNELRSLLLKNTLHEQREKLACLESALRAPQ